MEIITRAPTAEVTEYDITLINGSTIPIVIHKEYGDTISELEDRYVIQLSAKPSRINPDEQLQAETVTVYKNSIAIIQQRQRNVRLPTLEEQAAFKKSLLEMSGTIN